MRPPESTAGLGPPAAAAVDLVRRHFGHMSERQRDEILRAIRSKMAEQRDARGVRWAALVMGAAVACGALSGAVLVRHCGRSEPMSFRVEGAAEVRAGGYVETGSSEHAVLRFSDGSEVALAERARAHVRAVDEHGARVTIDEGHAHAYVVHAPETHWGFEVGPYVVNVTGTAFGISWLAAERRMDVRLENGAVAVLGPVFAAPLALRAGQWLTVRNGDVLIRDLHAPDSMLDTVPQTDPREAASAVVVPHSLEEGSSPPRLTRPSPSRSPAMVGDHGWADDLAVGRFAAILDEATRRAEGVF
jgi:hypothetical protein